MNKIDFEPNEAWDIKKILVFVAVTAVIAFSIKTFILGDKTSTVLSKLSAVEGISTQNNQNNVPQNVSPSQDLQQNLKAKLNDLKQEVGNLNVIDVATSTPAVKKVLNDFKNLQNLPQSQVKQACIKICDGL